MPKILGQLAWFIIVGASAAVVHWLVAVAVVQTLALSPLLANVVGWLVAFTVSFAGHYHYTFRQQQAPWGKAARRFFCVSATGFIANELLYFYLLRTTSFSYEVLLAFVLIVIAFFTFILSRFWAFVR